MAFVFSIVVLAQALDWCLSLLTSGDLVWSQTSMPLNTQGSVSQGHLLSKWEKISHVIDSCCNQKQLQQPCVPMHLVCVTATNKLQELLIL